MKSRFFSGLLIVFLLSTLLVGHPSPVQAVPIDADVIIPPPTWEYTGYMRSRRSNFTLSLLPDGRVLAAGGYYYDSGDHYLNSSEIFNPVDQQWSLVADSMSGARRNHTATTLLDGRILVVGGENATDKLNTAEIFDPATNLWSDAPPMTVSRVGHTATRLNDGRVLVVGGCFSNLACTDTMEIYNPLSNSWTYMYDLTLTSRKNHAASLLPDGTVLITGGVNYGTPFNTYYETTFLFDPDGDHLIPKESMSIKRSEHFMAVRRDGKVLVVGGYKTGLGNTFIDSTELYDPVLDSWTKSTYLWIDGRRGATAILDPFDNFYLIGGYNEFYPAGIFVTETRDIDSETEWNQFAPIDDLNPRFDHAAIQLVNGDFLIAGGRTGLSGTAYINTAEIYQDLTGEGYAYDNTLGDGVYSSAGTLLANGDLLITGGIGNAALNEDFLCSTRAYIWSAELDDRDDLAPMAYRRCAHTATLLADGRVVVIGGYPTSSMSTEVSKIEILNGNVWQQVSNPYALGAHTATLLPNGEILAISINTSPKGIIFNPDTLEIRQTTGSYTGSYNGHTATLLSNGKVMIYGSSMTKIMEIYDPQTELFTVATPPAYKFTNHTATLLEDGRVLLAGGRNTDASHPYLVVGAPLHDVRIYDPEHGSGEPDWVYMRDMINSRIDHTAVALLDGKVAVTGGRGEVGAVLGVMELVEVFDVKTNTWTLSGAMSSKRVFHSSLLSPEGNLLIFGGLNELGTAVEKLERYYFHNSPILSRQFTNPMWQPAITEIEAIFDSSGVTYTINGEELIGDVEASSGMSRQAATNFPFIRVMRLNNQQMIWLKADGSPTGTQFVAQENNVLAPGPVMIFDFASGSRSVGKIILSAEPPAYEPHKVFLPVLIK